MARIGWQCNHTVIQCHKVSYLRAMGDILTFPVWEVLWEVHVPVDLVEPSSAVHRRPGWDEQVQEVHLQILLIKLPRKGSFAVLCALTTFTFYFYLQTMNPQATRAHPHWGKAMEMWSMFWEISVQVEEHRNLKNHKRVVIIRNRWKTHVRKCTGSEPVSSKLEEVGLVVSEN